MLLRHFGTEKRNALPPRVLLVTASFLMGGSLAWPKAGFLHGTMSANGVDLIQGFLVGMAMAFGLMGIVAILGRKGLAGKWPGTRS